MKTWLITGCSSGIERGIALAALKQGNQAVLKWALLLLVIACLLSGFLEQTAALWL